MKETIKTVFIAALLAIGIVSPFAYTETSFAVNAIQASCDESESDSTICEQGNGASVDSVVEIVVNVLLFIVGIISVIMIIIGGIRFVTAGGNAASVTAARNTILYAVIGLIVAALAYAIVQFVVDQFIPA
jgi:hypothetical protein